MSNKLVKISGRKVILVYDDPNAFQYTGRPSDPMANDPDRDCLSGFGTVFLQWRRKDG